MRKKGKITASILGSSAATLLFSCAMVALSWAISLPKYPPKVPPSENTAFGVNWNETASSVAARATRRDRTLTFADRVAYQRAIEEVYWQHRIWPETNADPKPPLDKVMSHAQIEKKVEDYLRNSQAMEDYWQRPITPDQLQAEMERIASHTKQPGVLREIFAALGNDPFVIAECLARPVLTERLLTELYAHDERFHGELKRRAGAELQTHQTVRQMKETSGLYTEMEWIKGDSTPDQDKGGSASPEDDGKPNGQGRGAEHGITLNSREWNDGVEKLAKDLGNKKTGNALAQIKAGVLSSLREDEGHYYAVAVMNKGKDRLKLATIAWLKEPLRSWLAKAETQVPVTMAAISANYALPVIASPTGGCTDDTWTATSTTGAPAGRSNHTAVWTGSEMIVWGGYNVTDFNTGGRYNPSADSWTATSTTNAPTARDSHTAVWTGSEMIVWGGYSCAPICSVVNTGGRYNPSTNSWTATSTTNAPDYRYNHTAVWTGSEMIVWGGFSGFNIWNTGGRYNPGTNSWTATSTTSAPAGREFHTAVWTGSEMIVWGGLLPGNLLNTGGRYNPGTNSWTATSTTSAPAGRDLHTAVWTGSQMIVWGGQDLNGYLNTGGRYNPGTNSWTATSTTSAPTARTDHTAVWTGSQMIVWGGYSVGVSNTGGRYNPGTNSWTATSTINVPGGREWHTAVWIGSEMIVWGGYNGSRLDTGGRYCAASTSTTGLLGNISTRVRVLTGDNVLIGGFIVTGTTGTKQVLVRGLGPTLTDVGVTGVVLADPTLQLHHRDNQGHDSIVATNDNWKQTQQVAIQATGKAPGHDSEAAILQTLAPGNYTAILAGKNGTTGIGLVEVYDQNPGSTAQLSNISSRGYVGTGNDVMIGGFISAVADTTVIVRALGPTLTQFGISGPLADPVLGLFDANGNAIASNDNWQQSSQAAQIESSIFKPPNALEPAIISTRPLGNTTAIVTGKNGTTGVALVEVYLLP